MGETTGIDYADKTWSPWIGCTECSPGCTHCYAREYAKRFPARYGHCWGPGKPRYRTAESGWRKPRAWNRKATGQLAKCSRCGWDRCFHGVVMAEARDPQCGAFQPPRVMLSLCDWLDPEVDPAWLADLLALIASTPHLRWLLLSKRPELWRERMEAVLRYHQRYESEGHAQAYAWTKAWLGHEEPPDWLDHKARNVWAGKSVCTQAEADDVGDLLAIPARLRFLSVEPMLEAVDLSDTEWWQSDGIGWVICGGETGRDARPMHPDWARSLRDQCRAAGVPFLFKQVGEWAPGVIVRDDDRREGYCFPGDPPMSMVRVGKKAAGRELDGKVWDQLPEVA